MRSGRGRPYLTEAEGREAWAAYQRGISMYKIAQALNVSPKTVTEVWHRLGWMPNRHQRTRPRRQWMDLVNRLTAESGLSAPEVIWGALKDATVERLKVVVDEGIRSGEITPDAPEKRVWRQWNRARYKNRMHTKAVDNGTSSSNSE